MIEMRGPGSLSPSDNPTSLTYGKYDDLRMPWVGRSGHARYIEITDVSTLIVPQNENRVWLSIQQYGTNPVYITLGEPAVVPVLLGACGFYLPGTPGSVRIFDRLNPWPYIINAICGPGLTSVLLVDEIIQVTLKGRGE